MRRGGDAVHRRGGVVTSPGAAHHQQLRVPAQRVGGGEIGHAQRVVGVPKHPGAVPGQTADGLLTGLRKGTPRRQTLPQQRGKRRTLQRGGAVPQKIRLSALAAEGQRVRARRTQHRDSAPGEALRGRNRPGQGQLQHQIRAAAQRHLRPGGGPEGGGGAPLGEAAAHGHDHAGLRPTGADPGEEVGVTPVEGVELRDDSDDVHPFFLL